MTAEQKAVNKSEEVTEDEIIALIEENEEQDYAEIFRLIEEYQEILDQLVLWVFEHKVIRINPEDVDVELDPAIYADSLVQAGNPVRVKISLALMVQCVLKRNFYPIRDTVVNALSQAHLLLRTLAVVPIADYIQWNNDIRRWKKKLGVPEKILDDYLISHSRIKYTVTITAQHIGTGAIESFVTPYGKMPIERAVEYARRRLTARVHADDLSNQYKDIPD